MSDTEYTKGFRSGKKFMLERILAYLGTKTAEQPVAATFASEISRMAKDSIEGETNGN